MRRFFNENERRRRAREGLIPMRPLERILRSKSCLHGGPVLHLAMWTAEFATIGKRLSVVRHRPLLLRSNRGGVAKTRSSFHARAKIPTAVPIIHQAIR